ncbi:glycosyltransferase family 4 protein [Phocaeicola barnesiae]|uniref:glycosyltransferase family 4 protein n=1 Tax=Phocaeicola barnesiae TaxID=376804 RepID=UPI00241F37AD|nr:glycosyltransferase family 4 protein [Phocaeicola barnesiae]
MKINIASPGRFHVMDLARELDRCGFDVRFYSFVPDKRALHFGLRKECNASLFFWMAPFLLLSRVFPTPFFKSLTIKVQDYLTGILMRRCDVLIAMSGNYVYTLKRAKRKGAIVILERGSKHILEQKRILESIPSLKDTKPVPDINVKRELEGYELADYISIASQHVKRSFMERNYPVSKLFVNPYGVDLSNFKPEIITKKYDVIIVGGWTYQKGVDLLIKACQDLDLTLLHVGSIGDISFPNDVKFTHINPVDQKELHNYYKQAKIFVLPSRQEGMAMVQMQAIACGLPIVCSMHTGGKDIGELTGMKDWIFEMGNYSVEELKQQIMRALEFEKICDPTKLKLDDLSWSNYGRRYSNFLSSICKR